MVRLNNAPTLEHRGFAEKNPASSVQERMYTLYEMNPERLDYNITFSVIMEGALSVTRLQNAFDQCLKCNPMLTAKFYQINGELYYKIRSEMQLKFEKMQYEVNNDSFANLRKNEVHSFIKPFQLTTDELLMRAKLINYRDEKYLLLLDFHHIIFDRTSLSVFLHDLQTFYNYPDSQTEKKYNYRDFVDWQKQYVESEEYATKQDYWQEVLSTETSLCGLLVDYPNKRGGLLAAASDKIELLNYQEIDELCRYYGITKYTFFTGAFSFVLSKLTFQSDITLGTFVSGRHHFKEELSSMIGMFVNTIPIRNDIPDDRSFSDFLTSVQKNIRLALKHSDVLYETILDSSANKKNSPLFDVCLNYLESFSDTLKLEDVSCFIELEMMPDCVYDLALMVYARADSFEIVAHYAKDLYRQSTITRMLDLFVETINYVLDNRNITLEKIPISGIEERQKILEAFNDTKLAYLGDKTVVQLFEEQVEKTPDNIAIIFGNEMLTYKELNKKVNRLAHKLRDLGVKPDDYVAIMLDRSMEMMIGILGAIKAGGAYVPLDLTHPKDRIEYILEDCHPQVLLIGQGQVEVCVNIPTIKLGDEHIFTDVCENLASINQPNDLAYLIYTSGTTGRPKGVMVEHRHLLNLVEWKRVYDNYTENTTVLQNFNYIFDGSVWEIFPTLLTGCTLEILSGAGRYDLKELLGRLSKKQITMTPSMFKMLVNHAKQHGLLDELNAFERLYMAGEALPYDLIESYKQIPGSKIENVFNAYGPTEATVCATVYQFNQDDNRTLIGKPIGNTQVYILHQMNLCGIGVPGELCIAGAGVARGYLNLPDLTAKKFMPNPYGNGKLYRTGDLARWLPDGNIEYLGRIDDQVKIRGFRIELGEIESVIRKIADIVDVAVIVSGSKGYSGTVSSKDGQGYSNEEKVICAYFIAKIELDVGTIQDELRKELPEYMIPTHLKQIDKMPLTSNGKLDRKALSEIEVVSEKAYVSPRNEVEEKVCKAFAEVLAITQVGIHDQFFQIGGHSLKVANLTDAIEKETGVKLSLNDIFQYQTPMQIGAIIAREKINLLEINTVKDHSKASSGDLLEENDQAITQFQDLNEMKNHLEAQINEFEAEILQGPVIKQYPISAIQEYTKQLGFTVSGTVMELNQEINIDLLKKSIKKLIHLQGLMRSILIEKDDQLMIAELESIPCNHIPYINLSNESKAMQEAFMHYIVESFYENKKTEYGLCGKLLYNIIIVKEADQKYKIYLPFNHLIFDGSSMEILKNTLTSIYKSQGEMEHIGYDFTYEDYVTQINKGPQDILEDELIAEFELLKWSHHVKSFLAKGHHNFDFDYGTIKLSIDEDFKNRSQEEMWNIASQLFIKLMNYNFGMEAVPILMVSKGRQYETQNYYHLVGEFIDMLPFYSEDLKDSFTKIGDKLKLVAAKNINFLTLIYHKEAPEDFPKVKKLLEISSEELIRIPAFNYMGLFEEDPLSASITEMAYGDNMEVFLDVEITYAKDHIYIMTFCKIEDLETITIELQNYIDSI